MSSAFIIPPEDLFNLSRPALYLDQLTKAITSARGIAEPQMKDFLARAGEAQASKKGKAA